MGQGVLPNHGVRRIGFTVDVDIVIEYRLSEAIVIEDVVLDNKIVA